MEEQRPNERQEFQMVCRKEAAVLTDFGVSGPGQIGILVFHGLPQHRNARSLIRMEGAGVCSDGLYSIAIPMIRLCCSVE